MVGCGRYSPLLHMRANRPELPFKVESGPLNTSMPESGFKFGSFCLIANALTTRQAGGIDQ